MPETPPSGRSAAGREPDWLAARPARIERALAAALARPTGGWFVLGSVRDIVRRAAGYQVAGRQLVAWRGPDGALLVAPDRCPHLGAALRDGAVRGGRLVCRWHGLALGPEGHGPWGCLPAHDDGVLTWVRLDDEGGEGDHLTERPVHLPRPEHRVDAVMRMEARCEPRDVLANRLDPWHGAHFHPAAFADLVVHEATDDRLLLDVTYRLVGRLGVRVTAEFTCPEARTIVMRIVDGEGAGSLVETHAVPVGPARTAIVEATIATSDRPGFANAVRGARVLRGAMVWAARRLWVDDAAYAERLYALRAGEVR
ncbi:MAG: Rieske 2Fe-2S domain-containing protein [Acidimicrobiales bacterium]|nr:Rieske 2Fe-2S domain-containing protein [Acidimicrobiales bacterium]